MATINGIMIKSLKQFRGHEQEVLFQGNLYLNGKKLGFWSQDSHCGPDSFQLEGGLKQVRVLDDLIKGMYPEKAVNMGSEENPVIIKYGLEYLLVDLIALMGDEKKFKGAMKDGYAGILVATDGYHEAVWQLPAGYTLQSNDALLMKMDAALKNTMREFFPEDKYHKHSVKIYRSLDDFVVGAPLELKDKHVDAVLRDAQKRSKSTERVGHQDEGLTK